MKKSGLLAKAAKWLFAQLLEVMYALHPWLVGKPDVDSLLMIIQLFC